MAGGSRGLGRGERCFFKQISKVTLQRSFFLQRYQRISHWSRHGGTVGENVGINKGQFLSCERLQPLRLVSVP